MGNANSEGMIVAAMVVAMSVDQVAALAALAAMVVAEWVVAGRAGW